MWYIIVIFIIVFQMTISLLVPIMPNIEIKQAESVQISSDESWWDRLWTTQGMFGGVVILEPEQAQLESESNLPIIDTKTSIDSISSGYNPLEMFGHLMTFQVVGAEFVGILFWLSDVLLAICVIKLIRGGN